MLKIENSGRIRCFADRNFRAIFYITILILKMNIRDISVSRTLSLPCGNKILLMQCRDEGELLTHSAVGEGKCDAGVLLVCSLLFKRKICGTTKI